MSSRSRAERSATSGAPRRWSNHVDTVWVYWNMIEDFTPEGRPDIQTPPQTFRSEFLEKHYLNK